MLHSNLFRGFLLLFLSYPSFAQIPLYWTIDEVNPGQDVTLWADELKFTEGTKSCHLELNSGDVPYLISDLFYISPGARYEFSMDILDNDTAGQVKIYADFFDAYGFDIFGEPPMFSSDSINWQTIGWQGTVPPQAVAGYVLIKFYCQPDLYSFTRKADIWIDNARFIESGGNNLILNGSFEEWVVGIEEGMDRGVDLILYPNPAGDYVNVSLNGSAGFVLISDLSGKVLLRFEAGNKSPCRIDTSRLPEGMYILLKYSQGDPVQTGKLFILRR